MLTALTPAVAVWLLLGVSSMSTDDAKIDICSKDHGWRKISVDKRLFIVSPNHPMQAANSNMHCSCQVVATSAAAATTTTTADNSFSNGNVLANRVAGVNVSIGATVLVFDKLANDSERCWASLSTSSSSAPNGTDLLLCSPVDLFDVQLVTYALNVSSESFIEIEFRREELSSEDPVATFVLSIDTVSDVDLSVSCGQKAQPPVTHSATTWQTGFTAKTGTELPSSNSPDVVSTSRRGVPVTTSGPITASEPISSNGSMTDSTPTDEDRNSTVSGFSGWTSEQTTTNHMGPKTSGDDDENLEYYKVKVIAISVGVASVVFILLIVFMAYEIIMHRRRSNQQNETPSNDSMAPHRPDAVVCLPYADPGVDDQWWPGANSCSSPSAASWPGTEYIGSTSAQRLPDSAFIGPQTLPRSCANRPPIPIPVLQVEMCAGKSGSKSNGITASTFYDVIDLPPHTQSISTYNESEPDLAATAAVAALSESGRMTVDYADYEFPDNIDPTYTDMGQGRRGKEKPAFILPLTTCYLSTEDDASGGHLPTNRSNTSVEDNIDQHQPEPAYDEPRATTYENPVALDNDDSNQGASDDSSSPSSSSSSSVLSPESDHYDRLPPFRNRIN